MSAISRWHIMRNLDNSFLSNIKLFYVFGMSGEKAFVIQNNDNVYAFGSNINGCVGLGHKNAVQQPTLVEELCQKQVIDIQFGYDYYFVLALTRTGTVYSWGINSSLQLCHDFEDYKPNCISFFIDLKLIDIKTASRKLLALTECGDAYIWGNYQKISKIKLQTSHEKIKMIANGSCQSLVLTDNGDVYWVNTEGFNPSHENWVKLDIASQVTKIACGLRHSIMLSADGCVYCFGYNEYGQCGDANFDKSFKEIPTKIICNTTKFIDIECVDNSDISVGLSDNGFCYVWEKCGEKSLCEPTVTV